MKIGAPIGYSCGGRIRSARRRRGFSLAALAGFAGITEHHLRHHERGKAAFDPVVMLRLADGLGIAVDVLMAGGVRWTRWLAAAGTLISPHVFDVPAQYPDALSQDAAPAGAFRTQRERAAGASAAMAATAAPAPVVCQICRSETTSVIRICDFCRRRGWR